MREQRECILAGSRRGGRRTKKPPPDAEGHPSLSAPPSHDPHERGGTSSTEKGEGGEEFSPSWQSGWSGTPRESMQAYSQLGGTNTTTQSAVDTTIAAADIQNPSDALEILAQVAGDARVDRSHSMQSGESAQDHKPTSSPERMHGRETMLMTFPPLAKGSISVPMIHHLFAR